MKKSIVALLSSMTMLLASCGTSIKFADNADHGAVNQRPVIEMGASHSSLKLTGKASYYADKFEGRKTANGERFSQTDLTAAHKSLPFGTKLKVTNKANGKSVIVRVNDRGPYSGNRILDLSKAAAQEIGMISSGTANIEAEIL